MELHEYERTMKMLRAKREELGINLVELANKVGISPSQLNRMELGKTNSTYEKVHAVWQALREYEEIQQTSAESLMVTSIEWTYRDETRGEAARKMQDNDFSQLPVRDGEEAVGIITDFDLMRNPDDDLLIENLDYEPVIEVEPRTSKQLVLDILEEGYPAVLVAQNGEYEGIITKFDLLQS